jgi:acyl-CoA oxidase
MNPDLQRERQRATFSVQNVTYLLDGGRDRTDRRRQLEAVICNDPTGIFSTDDNMFLHRTDRHVKALAKHVRFVELCRTLGIGNEPACRGEILASPDFPTLLAAIADDLPTSLHWVMFVPNIMSLCDEEQKATWLPMCRDWRMIGCYAQTELGHVSA